MSKINKKNAFPIQLLYLKRNANYEYILIWVHRFAKCTVMNIIINVFGQK